MDTLYLATVDGLVIAERAGGEWAIRRRGLEGRAVTSVIAREGVVLAGTREGVWRSDDDGATWAEASAGLAVRHVRWLAYHPDISDREFAGTEPAAVYVSHDGAASWRECPEVTGLRERFEWYLPYSPEAGCVRGFAFHGRRAYAAVEVGGVLRSDDAGESWRLAEGSSGDPEAEPGPDVHPDVHSLAVHPSSPDLVAAPTGGGFYRSADGGRSWELLYYCYCRAVWLDPRDPNRMVLGPADNVDRRGRIEVTLDGGRSWQPAATNAGLPWPRHMVERFAQAGDELLAVLSNGALLAAPLEALRAGQAVEWRRLLGAAGRVAAVAVAG
jgi:photosystem II stability/assembly factor-like uncharacterized protein